MKVKVAFSAIIGTFGSSCIQANDEYIRFEPVGEPIRVDLSNEAFIDARSGIIRQYAITLDDEYLSDQYYFLPPVDEFQGQNDVQRAMELVSGGKTINVGVTDNDFWLHEDIAWTSPEMGFHPDTPLDENGQIIIDQYDPDYSRVFNDYIDPNNYYYDCEREHGTYVGGVIGATSNNSIGIAGFENVSVVPMRTNRCANVIVSWKQASAYVLDLQNSTLYPDYATNPTPVVVDVLNYSFGLENSCTDQDSINEFTNAGAIIVVAAGNESVPIQGNASSDGSSPANCDNVITVGSVNRAGNPSWFTNYGHDVDISAIGEEVLTTGKDNGYYLVNGTSFSAPIVSGVISLALSEFPGMKTNELKALLRKTARPYVIGDSSPCSSQSECGGGILDAKAFIEQVFIFNGISEISLSDPWGSNARSSYANALAHFRDDIDVCNRSELVISKSVFNYDENVVQLYSDDSQDFLNPTHIGTFTEHAELIDSVATSNNYYGYKICTPMGVCKTTDIQSIDLSTYVDSQVCS